MNPSLIAGDDPANLIGVLPTWVGDFVMATPALRAIRERFRESKITFLMEPNLRELVRGGDWMDDVLEWPEKSRRSPFTADFRRFIKQLRAGRFDCAILFPNSFRSAFAVWAARIPRRIGYSRDGRGWLLTDRIPVQNRRNSPYHIHNGREKRPPLIPPWQGGRLDGALGASPLNKGGQKGVNCNLPQPLLGKEGGIASTLNKGGSGGAQLRWYGADCDCRNKRFGAHAPVMTGRNIPGSPGPFIPMPMVHYYADLVEAIGCQRPSDSLELFTTPDCDAAVERRLNALGIADHHPLVVLSPGAKYGASKCWMPERFAATANRLIAEDGARVIITCGPGEESIAKQILDGITNSGGTRTATVRERGMASGLELRGTSPALALGVLMDGLSLGELKSLIRRCDLLVCNDAGPRHFAKAFAVPVVTIFGPTHPDWTATGYENEGIVRVDIDCGPCQQRVCPLGHHNCMKDVSVDMVVEASRELLSAPVASAAP